MKNTIIPVIILAALFATATPLRAQTLTNDIVKALSDARSADLPTLNTAHNVLSRSLRLERNAASRARIVEELRAS